MNRPGLLLVCSIALNSSLPAQEVPPPPPARKAPEDQPQHPPGHRPMFPGMMSRGGENSEMFKQLPEAERQRVRQAFEKVWNRPDVSAARENLNKANEDYRKMLHDALQEADPEVVKILEKIKPAMGNPMFARMPDPSEPEFGKRSVEHLAAELQSLAKRDGREGDPMRTHERLLQVPAVRAAVKQIEEARDPQEKAEAWHHLRGAYFSALRQEGGNHPRELRNGGDSKPKPPRGGEENK